MGCSLLRLCIWAGVLLVLIEQCHAGPTEKTSACTPTLQDACEIKRAKCREPDGKCVCEGGEEPTGDKCNVCTPTLQDACAKKGAKCREPDGKCECEGGEEPTGDKCNVCTPTLQDACAKKGAKCREPDGKCECEGGEEPTGDKCNACTPTLQDACAKKGAKCREPDGKCECEGGEEPTGDKCNACTPTLQDACAKKGAKCREPDGKCVCEGGEEPTGDKCNGCEEKIKECENTKKTSCKLINGIATCVCPSSMKETENGDCFVAKKLTIRFTLKSRQRRSATSSDKKCAVDREELIREIKLSVPSVIEGSIVCDGSDVTFDVFAENGENEKEITDRFEKCKQGCQIGAHISIEPGSAEVNQTNLCDDEAYQKLEKEMGLKCQYANETRMVCNNETSTVIGKATVQGIPFEVCKALPCTKTTCDDDKKHCVQGSCVCKPQYKDVDGKCKSMCEVTPSVCPVGATCVLGQGDQSFYCDCPPKLTGPLCTRENKPLQTAKLNIVVVGVVLASLLLLCFVVSASIISRLRKKVQGPSFSKDCERRPQRELRGYDGPYKASDPASLHRGRDHTSL